VVMIGGDAYGWEAAAPLLLSVAAFGRVPPSAAALAQGGGAAASLTTASEEAPARSWWFFGSRSAAPTSPSVPASGASDAASAASTLAGTAAALSNSAGIGDDAQQPRTPPELQPSYSKTLTLDSDGLKSLNLKPGENEAVFCVTSKMQGRATVQCVVHLWEHDEQVVISDIDGTITRSDIMGHAASILGRDWTHEGVAGLFTMISKNGYKFLYLTSRSISHAPLTREYLSSIEQDRGTKLPIGPIFFSPDNLILAFHREVIARNPQEFK
jgi:phosphatidate phosphatase LPIN